MSPASRKTIRGEEDPSPIQHKTVRRIRHLLPLVACIGLLSLAARERAQAFCYLTSPPTVWPNGNVSIVLKLGNAGRTLIDGNTSWDTVAQQALTTWNGHLGTIQFVPTIQSPGVGSNGDHINQAFFDSTIYGQSFGSNVLAVAPYWTSGTKMVEGDVIFNTFYSWDSYRGPLSFPGGQYLVDLRRVALHEFGHTLGLNHPDQAGQTVGAIMNSIISDLDSLTADDIAGALSLYPAQAPTITIQPQSQTVTVGSTVTFSVAASGSQPLSYQWIRNDANISGATSASYTISNVQTNQAGNYSVVVTNAGGTATSTTAVLTVNVPPSITAQPQSRTVTAGNGVTFSATASGTAPLSYQWSRNNSAFAGATTANYTISATQPSDAGDYKVRVSNVAGNVDSAVATLTVQFAPVISGQPQSQTVIVGDLVTFTVAAGGVPAPSYQWRFNGNPIPSASQANYAIAGVRTNDAGNYSVAISNALGQTNSATATLTVLVPFPGIYNTGLSDSRTVLPDGQVDPHYKLVVNPNNPASSSSVVQDSTAWPIVGGPWIQNSSISKWIGPALNTSGAAAGNYSYQLTLDLTGYDPRTAFLAGSWAADDTGSIFLNGTDTGFWSTNSFASFSTFALTNSFVLGTNLIEFKVSNAASPTGLRVESLRGTAQRETVPFVGTQPKGVTKVIGDNVTFAVVAGGASPFRYQWRFNGADIPTATGASLTLTNLQLSQAGNYAVIVTNGFGSAVSSNAVLTVNPPPVCVTTPSGLVSWWQGEGNAADVAGGNSGTLQGGVSFSAGMVGRAFNFDGVSNYVQVPSSSSLNPTGSFSIETWIYPLQDIVGEQWLVGKWGDTGELANQRSYSFTLLSGRALGFSISDLAHQADSSFHTFHTDPGAITLQAWNHVAAVYDQSTGTRSIFVNGLQVKSRTDTPITILNGVAPLTFGGFVRGGGLIANYMDGLLDEVSCYNRALSAAEIQAIYNVGSAGKCGLPPTILYAPNSKTVVAGANVTFGVTATGTPPLTYQWRWGSKSLSGATTNSYMIGSAQATNAGNYDVIVSNNSGSVTSTVAILMVGIWADVHYDFETAATTPVWLGTTQMIQNTSASHQGTNAIAFTGSYPNGYVLTALPQGTTNVEFYFYDDCGPNPSGSQYMFFRLLEATNSTEFAGFSMLDGGWGTTPPITMNHYYAYANEEYSPRTMGPLRTIGWHKFTFAIGPESVAMSVDDTLVFETNMVRIAQYLQLQCGNSVGWGRMDDLVLTGVTVPQPMLTVSRAGNGIRVAWPVSATGFVLQETILPAGNWTNSSAAVVVQGNENVAVIATTGTAKFYRLRK